MYFVNIAVHQNLIIKYLYFKDALMFFPLYITILVSLWSLPAAAFMQHHYSSASVSRYIIGYYRACCSVIECNVLHGERPASQVT